MLDGRKSGGGKGRGGIGEINGRLSLRPSLASFSTL